MFIDSHITVAIFCTPATFKVTPFIKFEFEAVTCFKILKGVQRPAAFAIVCFCFCEFRTVSYSGSCGEHDADFTQSMLVFVLPLNRKVE